MTNTDEIRQQMELLKDEELISIIQEHDAEQWRPEVFDIVNAILRERGVSPGKELEHEEDISDETPVLDLVTVADYFNYIDAETDRLALEAKGLKAWICNECNPLTEGVPPGVQLQVRSEDLTAAMAILGSEPVPSSDLPDEIAEPPCPKCGSRKVTEGAEIVEAAADATSPSPKQAWLYHCASCGHKWPES
jgi:DNA-directed RNA polymerase subunit M/transcription elongation factor TFIIS